MGFKNIVTLIVLFSAVALMLKLGTWQLQRLEWKNAMIAEMQAQQDIENANKPLNLDSPVNFAIGYIEGTFNENVILIGPRTLDGVVGRHVYTIIKTNEGKNIAINLGWVPMNEDPYWADLLPNRFTGYLRNPDTPNSFTPANDVQNNYWYSFNAQDFQEYYNVELIEDKVLYALSPIPASNIQHFEGLPYPRNKHAQYATFWFGMSGLLLGLSGFYIWRQRQIKRA